MSNLHGMVYTEFTYKVSSLKKKLTESREKLKHLLKLFQKIIPNSETMH
jgi:hypothetical protein